MDRRSFFRRAAAAIPASIIATAGKGADLPVEDAGRITITNLFEVGDLVASIPVSGNFCHPDLIADGQPEK